MNAFTRLVDLLDTREDAASLAVTRIALALVVFGVVGHTWATGVADAVWVDVSAGGITHVSCGWLEPVGGCTPRNVHVLMGAALGASVLLAAGLFTRIAAVATWALWHALWQLTPSYGGSSYSLLAGALFFLALSGCGHAWSLDARWRGKGGEVPAWPRWILIVQLVVMYWSTGVQKVGSGWLPGGSMDSIWFVLQDTSWHRGPMDWAWPAFALTRAASATTWLWENAAPIFGLALWFRRTADRPGRVRAVFNRLPLRGLYLGLGVLLHAGIEAFMEVGPFGVTSVALYACCFAPAEWRGFVARVSGRAASATSASAPGLAGRGPEPEAQPPG